MTIKKKLLNEAIKTAYTNVPLASPNQNGLMSKDSFMSRQDIHLKKDVNETLDIELPIGVYKIEGINGSKPLTDWGILVVFSQYARLFITRNSRRFFFATKDGFGWSTGFCELAKV